MKLVEEPKFDFAGWKTFSSSEDETAFNQQFVDRINAEALKSGVDIYIKPIDSDDTDRYDKKSGYWVVYRAALNEEGEILLKLLNTRNDKILTYKFSGFYKTEDKTTVRYYLVPAQVAIKKIVDEYINDKKAQKAEVRSKSFQGARAINSLSPEERKEALDWFSEHINRMNIRYPINVPTYTEAEGEFGSGDPDIVYLKQKFAKAEAKFHNDFYVSKGILDGYLDSAKKVHFEARDASLNPESTIVYYKMYWGLSCETYFDCSLSEAPEVVLGLIAQAKKDSAEQGNEVGSFKQEDKKINSIFLCYAIKELVNDDWDELSKIEKPGEEDDTFSQDFDNINAYGEKVESLTENAHFVTDYCGYNIYKDDSGDKPYWCQRGYTDQCWDMSFASLSEIKDFISKNRDDYTESLTEDVDDTCCICGEPLKGYGNNPEPYKHYGRCCDACNIKFVIPARLIDLNNEEE